MKHFSPIAIIVFLVAVLCPPASHAVSAFPGVRELTQPDGTTFRAAQWGDERMHGWETADGYAIVRDEASGFWFYAVHAEDGSLVSSGSRVSIDPRPEGIKKHLRITGEALKRLPDIGPQRKQPWSAGSGTKANP